jgi:hypothetical protein
LTTHHRLRYQPATMMSAFKRTMKTKTPMSGAALERVREQI